MNSKILPKLPQSWSELTWQQLNMCWQVKMRYGGGADTARAAALLALLGLNTDEELKVRSYTGEKLYCLRDKEGCRWTVTAREVAYLAKQAIPWFDYPYGDPGEKEQQDEKGNIVKAAREPVNGYVSPMRDAMILPIETVTVKRRFRKHSFALPQVACNNLTWQQYRALQTISPQLFQEGISDDESVRLQARFLANCCAPRSMALLDTTGGSIRIRPHYEYRYNPEQVDELERFWTDAITGTSTKTKTFNFQLSTINSQSIALFHICFQVYQTAISYYATSYPLLFADNGKSDKMRDALTGEVGTINTIMKYAGYAEQQQVYDSNLPFVLDILNTMTKEAKEIEKMNSKIKKK